MRRTLFLTALIGLCFMSGCGGGGGGGGDPGSPPPTATVSGTVTFNGAPLAGATVYAFLTNNNIVYQTTTTDGNGNYAFTGLPAAADVPEEYQFWVIKAGYGFYPSVGSGARVTRAGYNGLFQGNGMNDIAIAFTVIDYVVSSTLHLTGANFAAYNGSNPPVVIAKTGQTTSYVGTDDGSLQEGVAWPATRFVDNGNGTVTDNLTGLIWLQKAGCFAPTTWVNALTEVNQLASGQCLLNDGSSAGQWRLPNINELESLIDVSQSSPALTQNNHFSGVSDGIYWSSTTYFGLTSNAWAIQLSDGSYVNDSVNNVKATSSNGVWAVKGTGGGTIKLQSTGQFVVFNAGDDGSYQTGVPLTYPRWIDNGNGTVTDSVTGLIWLKQADCINTTWAGAITAISQLANGTCNLTDGSTPGQWRMPNRNEMESMADVTEGGNNADFFNDNYHLKSDGSLYQPAIFNNFVSSSYYWTSTTISGTTTDAWTVYSCDWGLYGTPKTNTGYTLAVR
jgi:hypothetical protein